MVKVTVPFGTAGKEGAPADEARQEEGKGGTGRSSSLAQSREGKAWGRGGKGKLDSAAKERGKLQ